MCPDEVHDDPLAGRQRLADLAADRSRKDERSGAGGGNAVDDFDDGPRLVNGGDEGNCVSNVLPSVSAVMPVLSERK
jgi:hypothetical protein